MSKSTGPLWPTGVRDPRPADTVFVISDTHDYKDPAGGPSTSNIVGPIGVKRCLKSIKKSAFPIVKPSVMLECGPFGFRA